MEEGAIKRILILIVVVLMCIGLVACGEVNVPSMFDEKTQADEQEDEQPTEKPTEQPTEEPTEKPTEKPTEQPTEEPTSDIPEGAEAVAILFMSPEIDMFITMKMPEWTYSTEMFEGEVFFFPTDNPSGETGVAISSQVTTMNISISEVWGDIAANFETAVPGFEWEQADDVMVGEYTAGRYSFVSDWFHGDYFFWNTEGRFYICSFTAKEGEYDELAEKLLESLETFQVLSDMQG